MLSFVYHGPEKIDLTKLREKVSLSPTPVFENQYPDVSSLEKAVKKYRKYKNVILIGNGGSRTSALAFYKGLIDFRNKVIFKSLTSAEPRLIKRLKKEFSKKNTLVLAISKSGDNVNLLEPLLSFLDYPVLVITGEKNNPLRSLAAKKKWEIILHPEIGGRFSGLTACGLVPAALMGLDLKKIIVGAKLGEKLFSASAMPEKNEALKMAALFWELEKMKYGEIFASLYSSALAGFLPLLIQLVHETYGKDEKGQTIFGDSAPESQHHTNQRLFGGPKNVIGLFFSEASYPGDKPLTVPKNLTGLNLKEKTLEVLGGTTGNEKLLFDKQGVITHCHEENIPAAEISVDEMSPENAGLLLRFFHYFVVYSAILRQQNPFNQPEVERSKELSFELRVNRKSKK